MEITTNNQLSLGIMVQAPYNILYDLSEYNDGNIIGKVNNEYHDINEESAIICSEAGRHLAILGSIALSQKNKEPNYYLATHALLTRKSTNTNTSKFFHVKASVNNHHRRSGEISGTISDSNNNIIFEAVISYQTLSLQLFSKLFGKFKITSNYSNMISPYQERRKLTEIIISENKITGNYGMIAPEDCEGHFENYPALPVAIIGNLLGQIGMQLFLAKHKECSKVMVMRADINAYRLSFHGEYVSFQGTIKEEKTNGTTLLFCEAIVNQKVIADAAFEIIGK